MNLSNWKTSAHQIVKYVTGLSKAHRSSRKFSPNRTNNATNLHHREKLHQRKHHNKASNEKGVGQHICNTLLTAAGENKGGYWLRQDSWTTPMWVLAPLGPNSHHLHRDYVKIYTDSHQLDIFSYQQDILLKMP